MKKAQIMGILNITPDSFSDGGSFTDPQIAINRAKEMIQEGVDIIDIGAESTAPGNMPISFEEEWYRLSSILPELLTLHTPLSLDTQKAQIMELFLKIGGTIINDVSGGIQEREEKRTLFKKYPQAKYICMFSQRCTKVNLSTKNIWEEMTIFFEKQIEFFCAGGVKKEQFILDTGMGGFLSPDPCVSFEVLKNIKNLCQFELPILIGTSRKSFLKNVSHPIDAKQRTTASIVSMLEGVRNGADIVRVHDIAPSKEALSTFYACQ